MHTFTEPFIQEWLSINCYAMCHLTSAKAIVLGKNWDYTMAWF